MSTGEFFFCLSHSLLAQDLCVIEGKLCWGGKLIPSVFVHRLKQRGIGTLIDVHGLPGGANGNDHSGTNSGKAEFWSSKKNKQLAAKVMCFIAEEAKTMDGVAGLQIVNEAEWGAKGMFEWYDEVLKAVGKVDPTLPIYISDAWALDTASSWSKIQNQVRDGSTRNPVVVDTHLYWCFEEKDRHKSPREISDEVSLLFQVPRCAQAY